MSSILNSAIGEIKTASQGAYPAFVDLERLSVVSEMVKTQADFLRSRGLTQLKQLGPQIEEADFFLSETQKVLTGPQADYNALVKVLWDKLVLRHRVLEEKWLSCKPHESVRGYSYFARLESLSQFLNTLKKESTPNA